MLQLTKNVEIIEADKKKLFIQKIYLITEKNIISKKIAFVTKTWTFYITLIKVKNVHSRQLLIQ